MSLRDIMSHADLSVYPEASLVLFLAVFLAVAWRVSRRAASQDAHDAALPLGGEDSERDA
jgi:hypothetical protein